MTLALAIAGACLVAACNGAPDNVCVNAQARTGRSVCAERITNTDAWNAISVSTDAIDQARTSKYFVPATANTRLPTLFLDVNSYSTHFQMMVDAFGDRFAGLTLPEYVHLITHPQERELFAGSITEYLTAEGSSVFGYVVWDDQIGPDSTLSCEQFHHVKAALESHFHVAPLHAIAASGYQRDVLATCQLPTYDPSAAVDYEAYSEAVGYGTIRRYRVGELPAATALATFGFQDILVIDEAPLDIETVVSGTVTGTRQGELSHLNVRSTSRGTPNCFVRDAYSRFEAWQGQLVRLECGARGLTVEAASQSEADAWWDQLRPEPVTVPTPDLAWTSLARLLDAPTATPQDRATLRARYGAKGGNLAALYQRIAPSLRLEGFLVPMHYYDQFMRTKTWTVDLGNGPEQASFARTIDHYLGDASFVSDGAVRRVRLQALQTAMHGAPCDAALLEALATEVRSVFAQETVMVRLRSSSNAEDALGFNGAGLYRSTSACLADDTDADNVGPSRCDPDTSSERGLCRGLTRVWASLWEPKAFDERSWFGIDHVSVAMAVLVNTRSKNERTNIVAFTGNPNRASDLRYLVNAQIGTLDVVSAAPGVYPEKNVLTLTDGTVSSIERSRSSTELPADQVVLSDEQLRQLGATLYEIGQSYPVDSAPPTGARLLLDTEWKILENGRLIIKQVRPFSTQ